MTLESTPQCLKISKKRSIANHLLQRNCSGLELVRANVSLRYVINCYKEKQPKPKLKGKTVAQYLLMLINRDSINSCELRDVMS